MNTIMLIVCGLAINSIILIYYTLKTDRLEKEIKKLKKEEKNEKNI